jgi:hypothetical protein
MHIRQIRHGRRDGRGKLGKSCGSYRRVNRHCISAANLRTIIPGIHPFCLEGISMRRLGLLLLCFVFCTFLPRGVFAQTKVYRSVSNETVEKILQGLELKYQKDERKNKDGTVMFFDFQRGDLQYRLYNYNNDLWIESTLDKKMTLEEVNRWNADAKFSRLVLIEQKDKTTMSLESQLDALGGVTEPMIRQYINRFDEEAKRFAKFAK